MNVQVIAILFSLEEAVAGPKDIAIVGMAARFPEAENIDEFWRNLRAGRESVGRYATVESPVPERSQGHWVSIEPPDPKAAGLFDREFFGLSPRDADLMEPQQRLILEAAWHALEDGCYAITPGSNRVGVFVGGNYTSYFTLANESCLPDALDGMLGCDKDYLATRVAHHLGLRGPAVTVQCACSTSLVAVHLACQALMLGECDAALAGAASLSLPRLTRYYYTPGAILSPDACCRPFDAEARGTTFTEGGGLVLLMPLKRALELGHRIYAVIKGSAVNNDGGEKSSYLGPSIEGQQRVIRAALTDAGASAAEIGAVEAHGTATTIGDAIEIAALTRVFDADGAGIGQCQLGSVKANIGHTAAAAGVAGLIKMALCLHKEELPPQIHFEKPNPDLNLIEGPFAVSGDLRAWPRSDRRRLAGVSSFGVGGTNAHVVLEEAPAPCAQARPNRSAHLLTISGHSAAALAENIDQYRSLCSDSPSTALGAMAWTSNLGRTSLTSRFAAACTSVDEAQSLLSSERPGAISREVGRGRVAFVFPGQGSQMMGMGAELGQCEPIFRSTVSECIELLRRDAGLDLGAVFFGGSGSSAQPPLDLRQTAIAQPALFVIEYALAKTLMEWGITPCAVLGHSLGEYAAACVAGVFDIEDALRVVAARGRLMQALPHGSMLSVGAAPKAIEDLISGPVELAAVNAPRNCVLSGPTEQIRAVAEHIASRGFRASVLSTSHAFHSAMMEPMLEQFARLLEQVTLRPPTLPLISNLGGRSPIDFTSVDYWCEHARQPVQFAAGLQALADLGTEALIEVGPGAQATTLARLAGLQGQGCLLTPCMPQPGKDEQKGLMTVVGAAWCVGATIDWERLHGRASQTRSPLPLYAFQRQPHRLEPSVDNAARSRSAKLPVGRWLNDVTWRSFVPGPDVGMDSVAVVFMGRGPRWEDFCQTFQSETLHPVQVMPGRRFRRHGALKFTIRPDAVSDYKKLFSLLSEDGIQCSRVVHAWSCNVGPAESWIDSDLVDGQALGFLSLCNILSAHRSVFGPQALAFDILTTGACLVDERDEPVPQNAAIMAFAHVAPQEQSGVTCRVVDVDAGAGRGDAPLRLAAQMFRGADAGEIAVRGGAFWKPEFEERRSGIQISQAHSVRRGGVYLIVGGLGNVGYALAEHIAQAGGHLAIVGRRDIGALEGGEVGRAGDPHLERLAHLRTFGVRVDYLSADVGDLPAVKQIRRLIRGRFGRLDGIVFGAGHVGLGCELAHPRIAELLSENLQPKAKGLANFLCVFGDEPLDWAMVLSSISTVLGGLQHGPYAAANHVADSLVAQHNRISGARWTAVNWDLWEGAATEGADQMRLGRFAEVAITAAEGCTAFEMLLASNTASRVVISTRDLNTRLEQWVRSVALETKMEPARRPDLPTRFSAPQGELEEALAAIWQDVLGLEGVGRDDDFFDLGGHSLLVVQIQAKFQADFRVASMPSLYEHPTVRSFVEEVENRLEPGPAVAPESDKGVGELAC